MVRVDDTDRVFDVSRPGRSSPDATSRPLVVGHRPQAPDPMVGGHEDDPYADFSAEKKVTSVPVTWDAPEEAGPPKPIADHPESTAAFQSAATDHAVATEPEVETDDKTTAHDEPPSTDTLFAPDRNADKSSWHDAGQPPVTALPLGHTAGAGPRRPIKKIMAWLAGLLVLAGIGTYLAIDAGLVGANVKLPYEFFKEKEPTPAITQSAASSTVSTPAVPEGFTSYKLAETSISFAYPAVWGSPSVTAEPGYKTRTNSNVPAGNMAKPDGTHAFMIGFAVNKDVQIAVTSSKYLPGTRAAAYYDFLQWCVGTNDGKFYKQRLLFSTTAGTDTPTTITCNEGPLTDAVKMDDKTIIQTKTKDADNRTVIGDLYTTNLTDKELTVLRVKDATSANSELVKKLLSTIKIESSQATP